MAWTRVATAPNEPIGESWAGILRDRGVPAFARGEAWRGVYFGMAQAVRIMVPEERLEEARALLNDILGLDEEPPDEAVSATG